jgi:hypothetical protein
MARAKALAAWIGQLAANGLVVTGLILAVAALFQWARGGWDTARYAESAINLGFVVAGLGALVGIGRGWGTPQYQAARTAGGTSGEERARQDFAAAQPPVPFMLTMMTGGLLAMAVGFLL